MMRGKVVALVLTCAAQHTTAFLQKTTPPRPRLRASSSADDVEAFVRERYPSFESLTALTNVWETLRNRGQGATVFAPTESCWAAMGKRRDQLRDPRNLEAAEKIVNYHVVDEPVTKEQLQNSGGLVTLGGQLDVGQTTSGGLFGFGGKEDGGVKINTATILESFSLDGGKAIVHEVDRLVSPELLWRYVDQLRIPGSS